MVIATDADGVLTDMSGFNFIYGKKFFGHEPINPEGYTTAEIFGESKGREFLFGLRHFYDYCSRLEPRENAAEVCRRLRSDGHNIYVITARKFSTMNNPLGSLSRSLFRRWTVKNELVFADIFFCSEENTPPQKLRYCKQISADIMIEDKSDIALHLAENGIKVLLFDTPYNKSAEHENIVRVHTWKEIYKIIERS
ncbi:MAG: hypothetical protein ACI4I1_04070 [Oscillospiraceae bacterium]